MDEKDRSKTDPEALLSAWFKAATEAWGSIARIRHDDSAAFSEKPRFQKSLETGFQTWQKLLGLMSDPGVLGSLTKGTSSLPDIAMKMAQTAWEGYFNLQEQWIERMGRIGKSTEAYKFEELDLGSFKVWTEIYEKEFRQLLRIPQLGLSRYYQERMTRALDKLNLFQASIAEFLYLLYLPMEQSSKVVQEKIMELADEGKLPETTQEYYRMWIKVLEGHYMTLFKSPEYIQVMAKALNATEDFMVAKQEFLRDGLQQLPIPTNKDMDDLYKELYLLKKRIKALEKTVDQLVNRGNPAESPERPGDTGHRGIEQ